MNFKRSLSGLVIAALPCFVSAAPTVTFQGEVSSQTCSVNINGQANSVVLLPAVSFADFGAALANGASAGQTSFTVSLTQCTAPEGTAQAINTRFTGYDVDSTTGVLKNRDTSVNAATGFGIQLTASASGSNPIMLSGATDVPGLVLSPGATSTSYDFGARYYVIDKSKAKAGKITAVAEYTLSYL